MLPYFHAFLALLGKIPKNKQQKVQSVVQIDSWTHYIMYYSVRMGHMAPTVFIRHVL